ncbi:hypothetical protein D6745_01700 [Candidatus Woesearchaeota archaeon]|nr:MAG: hypothetical protein D6745_01700 [Candidatus Woesearchaeota archaeon]
MSEYKFVVEELRLAYEGLMNVPELYSMIDQYFREKQYDKREVRNFEQTTPDGKNIELEIQPYKKITDYAKLVIKIRMFFYGLQDVVVEKDGLKIKMQKGKVEMIFDSFLETDYEHRWEQKPTYFLIRTLFDKFIYKIYTTQFEKELEKETNHIHDMIKSFLNLQRY